MNIAHCSIGFLMALAALSGSCGPSMADQSNDFASACQAVLTNSTVHVEQKSKRAQLAWMSLVNDQTYENSKAQINLIVPGYGDGDYGQFDEKRRAYFAQQKYTSDTFESAEEVLIESHDAIKAWGDCIKARSFGLFVYAVDIDDYGATLVIVWHPAPGLHDLRVSSTNVAELAGMKVIHAGEVTSILKRKRKGAAIRGTLNAVTSTTPPGAYAAQVYIPVAFSPLPKPTAPCMTADLEGRCVQCRGDINLPAFSGAFPFTCSNLVPSATYTVSTSGESGSAGADPHVSSLLYVELTDALGNGTSPPAISYQPTNPGEDGGAHKNFFLIEPQPVSPTNQSIGGQVHFTCNNGAPRPCNITAHWQVCLAGTTCQ